ncbi:MAG: hypothetical protein JO257_20530 [Deltaproteobacteria bacterium]|nr:hypothetical protein [Deltaproteobacteria bacterium]
MRRLIEALRLLAAPAAVQRSVLPTHVAVADEVAMIFSDELVAATESTAAQPANVRRMLEALDELLNTVSQDAGAWDIDLAVWTDVRLQARAILDALGAAVVPPTLDWLTYV